ncbi:MAG: restriction endonuclease subunit S [Nanoarchaeota archaeon]|nr:restriction endonuclease subunit S [Nanoarchaeota archaeon]MBU1977191.1 restriction endonuclease subunit S [Nanoarchaeota archaeon]
MKKERIGDACIVGDGAHAKIKRQETGILYLTSKNFKSHGLDLSKVDYISEEDYNKYFKENSKALTKPKEGDVVFSIIGSIGQPHLVKRGEKFGLSSSVSILRAKKEKINEKYLYYWIKGPIFQQAIYSTKGGVAQSYLSLDMIKSLPIQYGSISIQEKIVTVLSNYDDLSNNNTKRIELLEKIAKLIYEEWFVKFKFPGHEKVKFVDSELGKIPEGWEIKKLGDFVNLKKDKYSDFDKDLPLLDMSRIPRKSWLIDNYANSDELKTSRIIFDENDILFGSIRPYFHKVVFANKKGITNTSVFVLRPNETYFFEYILLHLFDEKTVEWATTNSGGTKMPVIKWDGVFKKKKVIMPSKEVLIQFSSIINPIISHIKIMSNQNQNLSKTRDLLLPRLITGKVDVSELDIQIEAEA